MALYDTEQEGLLADALYSQIEIHAEYGGVVPELASRDHVRKTLPLIDQVLSEAGITEAISRAWPTPPAQALLAP